MVLDTAACGLREPRGLDVPEALAFVIKRLFINVSTTFLALRQAQYSVLNATILCGWGNMQFETFSN